MKKVKFKAAVALTMIVLGGSSFAFGFAGGDGSAGNPWQISTKADLEAVNNDLTAHYILVNDIDLSNQSYTTAVIAPDIDNTTDGFQGTSFEGSFDGNSHVIKNLTINTAGGRSDYLGLFGRLYINAEVKNLGVENCNITSGDCSQSLGGLCGVSTYTTISNCFATGTITSGVYSSDLGGLVGFVNGGSISNCYATVAVSGDDYIGGLFGSNFDGSIFNSYATGAVNGGLESGSLGGLCGHNGYGSISNCYATGAVTGGKDSSLLGGLCGYNGYEAYISNCYATGAVIGDDGSGCLGGLCGAISTSISNCYATGAITGGVDSSNLGGLCGYNLYEAYINNCYATGAVTGDVGSGSLGGLCGTNYAIISNCYWDTETSGMNTSAGGTGRTTAEMQTESTFTDAGWDFVTVWKILREYEDYPRLAWQEEFVGDIAGLYGIDMIDFAYLSSYWGLNDCNGLDDCGRADTDNSGDVGITDLTNIAEDWLKI